MAELEGPRSIATATIEKRQFFRYAHGEVRTPQTVARRVLEFMFPGIPAVRLPDRRVGHFGHRLAMHPGAGTPAAIGMRELIIAHQERTIAELPPGGSP